MEPTPDLVRPAGAAPEPGELDRLRARVRDLVACLGLPALWSGRDAPLIAAGLLDVLVSMLRADAAYLRLTGPSGDVLEDAAPRTPAVRGALGSVVEAMVDHRTAVSADVPSPFGDGVLRTLVLQVAADRDAGVVLVAAGRPDFPTETERFLARSAVNQAAIALQTTALLAELRASDRLKDELIARERAARAEAEAANRSKDEFLAVLSHELRTPLNSVLGWAVMLQAGGLHAEATARALTAIERNARAQVQLIEDLLDVSRIVTGQLRLDLRPTDLRAVVDQALEVMRPAAVAGGVALEASALPRLAPVWGDADRLRQVLLNLLSNAVKFSPRGGRVQVALHTLADGQVELVVRDTGKGIAPDLLPHVFDRFRQGDGSSTREHGGLGIGLALARHIVELHGGTITAASDGPGRGAILTVRVPGSPPGETAEAVDRAHLVRLMASMAGRAEAAAATAPEVPPSAHPAGA